MVATIADRTMAPRRSSRDPLHPATIPGDSGRMPGSPVPGVGSPVMFDAQPQGRRRRIAPVVPILLLIALAGVVLIVLARSMTFFQDEWGSIEFHGGPLDFIRPVNEHWSTIPLLLYRATFAIVGLHSYLPFVAQVIVLHLIAVGAAFVLIRTRAGATVATVACIPLLFLGSGAENLFWAFQTGFVGSVTFGLWGLVLLERRGRAAAAGASILLLASLMASGMGLFFLVAAAGRTLLDSRIRRRSVALVVPAIAYAIWYVTLGSAPVAAQRPGLSSLVHFVVRGIGHAVGALSGLGILPHGNVISFTIFAVVAAATGWAIVATRRPPALAGGALLAVVAMYATIGLVRADLPSDFATRSRYVYVAAFLLVLAVADWLPLLRDWAGDQRWRRAGLTAVLSIALVVATAANIIAFGPVRAQFQAHADMTRAYIELALANRGASWVDPASGLLGMPPLPVLVATIERYGSPLRDDIVPGVVRDPSPLARESALLRMVGTGFRAEPGSGNGSPIRLAVGETNATGAWDGPCFALGDVGRRTRVTVQVPTGVRVRVTASNGVEAHALLGLARPPSRSIDVTLVAGKQTEIVVPDIGSTSPWTVRLDFPAASGTIEVCGIAQP
jgi:hypothetical protein